MSILWTPATEVDGKAQLEHLQEILSQPHGFLQCFSDEATLQAVEQIASTIPAEDSILLLGIGGSALGAQALAAALAPDSSDRLKVLDNIDVDTVERVLSHLDLSHTTVLVISKSGATAETSAQLLRIMSALESAGVDPDQKIVAITDREKGVLRQLATERNWRSLEVPSAVGGRFSVLTAVGLLPAKLIGIDIRELTGGAARCLADLGQAGEDHGLVQWASHWAQLSSSHRTVVLFPYRDRLRTFGDWFAQLWAESLGKRTDLTGNEVWTGSTPLVARGVTDQHSLVQLFAEGPDDKQYVFLDAPVQAADPLISPTLADLHPDLNYLARKSLDQLRCAEWEGTIAALRSTGRPVSTLQLEQLDEAHLGALILLWQVMTLLAAKVLAVNPFDQPGVEAGKAVAFAKMGREDWQQQAAEIISGAYAPGVAPPIDC
ncbi:MAG: glucose-6-phosphate isomerase [Planctomycetota bacterium]|nr:glucose-6-phosphate isomerase [Planctomycetota bacterium]